MPKYNVYPTSEVEQTRIVNKQLNSNYGIRLIRKILKVEFNLSYKRLSSRSNNNINVNRNKSI